MKTYIDLIKSSQKIQWVLLLGLLVQIIFCITSVGYFHPDQHFQIIEFSSYQLNKPNAATAVWEFSSNIRPTIQVYIFSVFRLCCDFLKINNAFHQLTILRLLQGLLFWVVFNLLAIYYCNKNNKQSLFIVLFIINFSWFLPYSRTIFSSEMVSALIFFPAITFLYRQYINNKLHFLTSIYIGFLLALSFYLRFQIAFAIIGFGIWIILIERQFKISLYLFLGFVIGILLNVFLDNHFYNKLVFTPYLYYKVNILQGVAASFGEKSFTYYIGILIGIIGVPFISILLLYQYAKTSLQHIKHPIVLSTLFFIIGHFFVGHKEERFMFTVINVIPIIIALNANSFNFLKPDYRYIKLIKPVVIFSLGLNFLLLVLFIFNPYSQTINFNKKISEYQPTQNSNIFCYTRTSLQTESLLPLTYYKQAFVNTNFINVNNIDSVAHLQQKTIWLAATFNDLENNFNTINTLGFKPVFYSSPMLWRINTFLASKKINTINDIWVLYKLDK